MKLQLLFLFLLSALYNYAQSPIPDSIQQEVDLIKEQINILNGDSTDVELLIDWYIKVKNYDQYASLEPLFKAADICEKRMIKASANQGSYQYDYNEKYGGIIHAIALGYQSSYNYKQALEFYFKAIKHHEKFNRPIHAIEIRFNIAGLYLRMNEHDFALAIYNEILKNKELLSDEYLGYLFRNKAIALSNKGKHKEAIILRHKALPYTKGVFITEVYSDMSENFFNINKPDSAFFFLEKALALELEAKAENPINLIGIYLRFASFQYKSGMYSKAIFNAKLGLTHNQKVKILEHERAAYHILSDCYKALNKSEKAFENYQLYIELRDSIHSLNQVELAYRLNAEHEYERKAVADSLINDNKIALLDQDNQQKIQVEKTKTTLAITALIVILLLTLLIGNAYRQNKIIARNLEEKNTLMEEALRTKEAFMAEIHHRVKNNMQMVSSVLSLKARESINEETRIALEESQARIYSMSLSHQKMYQESSFEEINLSAYVKDIVETLFVSYQNNELTKFNFEAKDISINIEQAQAVGFIIHELVANSIKHAWAKNSKKQLDIILEKKDDKIDISYKDNGKGLPKEFNLDEVTSMGLKLVKAFTKRQLKGFINFSSEQGCNVNLIFTPRS